MTTRAPFDPSAAAQPGSGIFGLPHSVDEARVVVLPVAFDATTSYGKGASQGPEAIFEASKQVDLFDLETGRPYEQGIALLRHPRKDAAQLAAWNREARRLAEPIIAAGGAAEDAGGAAPRLRAALERVNAVCESVNLFVYERARELLGRGKLVALVGGDHATPFGSIRAHTEAYPGLGVLHVDAHADLRRAYEGFVYSHASIMYNVCERLPEVERLVQVGVRDFSEDEYEYGRASRGRVVTHFDTALAAERFDGATWAAQCRRIVAALPREVYVSFDIDGLDPALCPHTGTPVPGGLSFHQACALIAAVARSGRRIVGLDLNEVAPGGDGGDWDANVGARLLYKLIGWALRSEQAPRQRAAPSAGRGTPRRRRRSSSR